MQMTESPVWENAIILKIFLDALLVNENIHHDYTSTFTGARRHFDASNMICITQNMLVLTHVRRKTWHVGALLCCFYFLAFLLGTVEAVETFRASEENIIGVHGGHLLTPTSFMESHQKDTLV